jgi:hypothetical protein
MAFEHRGTSGRLGNTIGAADVPPRSQPHNLEPWYPPTCDPRQACTVGQPALVEPAEGTGHSTPATQMKN